MPQGDPHDQGSAGDILVGRILTRGLRVLRRLGSTPEGPLYQAEYPNGVEVALVVLRSNSIGGEPFKWERCYRAAQIQHPNVAAVHEVGEMEDGSVYAVLEHLVGEPLSDLLPAGEVFPLTEAVDLVLQAAAGLRAAYREGFVHGNLSPHTLLVTRDPYGRPVVKLIGFTLNSAARQPGAKSPIPDETGADYASPERLVGHPPDERSEVFSLGAVLHHLLTGVPPARDDIESSVPKVARAVLGTALASAPESRFQTISELGEALQRLAAVAASPKRPVIPRAPLIGAAAASVALVTGGIWMFGGSKLRATSKDAPALVAGSMYVGGAEHGRPATPDRQDAPRTPRGPEGSDRTPAVARAGPVPRATRPQSPEPAAVAKLENQTEKELESPEALGYVAPEARRAEATPPTTRADPRSRAELERDEGLRHSIGDVMRIGIAEEVNEVRLGALRVSLSASALDVPSVTYNLQRLYLAYSAASAHREGVTLELWQGGDLYGWFTRDGLRRADAE